MFKKCKVVMLPTNEKANALWWSGHKLYVKGPEDSSRGELNHLYFLSDEEEIKEGDWCYDKVLNVIFQTDEHTDFKYINQTDMVFVFNNVLKIIATTDDSLAIPYDGKTPISENWGGYKLPQPSQSFIEKYVEEYNNGNVITEVMVEYTNEVWGNAQLIIPSKPKVNPKDNTITIRKVRDNFNFNREEMLNLLERAWNGGALYGSSKPNSHYFDKLIEENL